MHLCYFNDWQDQDDAVQQTVDENRAKEERRWFYQATAARNGLVPVCLNRNAVEYHHECSYGEPDGHGGDQDKNRDTDRGIAEDAPVEGQDCQL